MLIYIIMRRKKGNSAKLAAVGVAIIITALFFLLCLFNVFGSAGGAVKHFLLGVTGFAAYAYALAGIFLGCAVVGRLRVKISFFGAVKYAGLFFLGIYALQIITSSPEFVDGGNYGGYLSRCYDGASTAGGAIAGVFAYPLMRAFTTVGALVFACILFFAWALLIIFPFINKRVPYTDDGVNIRKTKKNVRKNGHARIYDPEDFESAEVMPSRLFSGDVNGGRGGKLYRADKYEYSERDGFDIAYPNAGFEGEIFLPDAKTDRARRVLFGDGSDETPGARILGYEDDYDNQLAPKGVGGKIVRKPFNPDPYGISDARNKLGKHSDSGAVSSRMGADEAGLRRTGKAADDLVDGYPRSGRRAFGESFTYTEKPVFGKRPDFGGKGLDTGAKRETADAPHYGAADGGAVRGLEKDEFAAFSPFGENFREHLKRDDKTDLEKKHDNLREEMRKRAMLPEHPAYSGDGADKSREDLSEIDEYAPRPEARADVHGASERNARASRAAEPTADTDGAAYRENRADNARRIKDERTEAAKGREDVEDTDAKNAARDEEAAKYTGPLRYDWKKHMYEDGGGKSVRRRGDRFGAFTEDFGGPDNNSYSAYTEKADEEEEFDKDDDALTDDEIEALRNAAGETGPVMGGGTAAAGLFKEEFIFDADEEDESLEREEKKDDRRDKGNDKPPRGVEDLTERRDIREPERPSGIVPIRGRNVPPDRGVVPPINNRRPVGPHDTRQVSIEEALAEKHIPMPYSIPSIALLKEYPSVNDVSDDSIRETSRMIEMVLKSFGVDTVVERVIKGPTFSRYILSVDVGTDIKKIVTKAATIALHLGGENIDILAPIPGLPNVGIDVPNKERAIVGLKELICSAEFAKSRSKLCFPLGKDLNNTVYICDIAKMPHLLIAGTTNSGKSVCINSMIVSILYNASPDEVKFIMIDPKMVELVIFNGIPHMLLDRAISDPDHAVNAFDWAIKEMFRRFQMFTTANGSKNIDDYNNYALARGLDKVPFIVIVIDELANLINSKRKKDVEEKINKLASMARAAGIHLVVATQRPSVDNVPGSMKSNLPSRIAFNLASVADAKTILSAPGPEKLLSKGDMLYHPSDRQTPIRLQGGYMGNDELTSIVEDIKRRNRAFFDSEVQEAVFKTKAQQGENAAGGGESGERAGGRNRQVDPYMFEAMEFFMRRMKVTATSLQTYFRMGFSRAKSIVMDMEILGMIASVTDEPNKYDILIDADELNELKARYDNGEDLFGNL
ncbi:MAG: hypothetical protein LBT55_01255 [Clostridiaceae bacterium]|jgi:DNA segregation ATPase FtsK/SpoIIIE-like protein|nr:hypothetical protein [Clostridiaceae bacterium]